MSDPSISSRNIRQWGVRVRRLWATPEPTPDSSCLHSVLFLQREFFGFFEKKKKNRRVVISSANQSLDHTSIIIIMVIKNLKPHGDTPATSWGPGVNPGTGSGDEPSFPPSHRPSRSNACSEDRVTLPLCLSKKVRSGPPSSRGRGGRAQEKELNH